MCGMEWTLYYVAKHQRHWVWRIPPHINRPKVMNMQVRIRPRMRVVFKYIRDKDRLIAKKILLS